MATRTSKVSKIIKASQGEVYNAFVDPTLIAIWLAPNNMKGTVHEFEPREGGKFRMTLEYLDKRTAGKTAEGEDSFQASFVQLVPFEKIVWSIAFDSDDPTFRGTMIMTADISIVKEGTEVVLSFDNLPSGIAIEDNNEGSRQSLEKLAKLLEN